MWQALDTIVQALFPSSCAACGEVLMRGERQLCLHCISNLSRTLFDSMDENPVERLLVGRIPVEHAIAPYLFSKGNTVQQIVHSMKFRGNDELCLLMGRQLGLTLLRSTHFDGVDLLVPVPLHWWRRLCRGYNQSESLCRGIAEVFPRPISTHNLVRHHATAQQSLQHADARSNNVEGAFSVRHPERFEGKHLLLVDDVLTTGATLTACYNALRPINGLRISVATLCTVL